MFHSVAHGTHGGMEAAAHPLDENERLMALRDLEILDTPPSESFDRITRLAADLLEVPIALVSLVDEDRQWFKSCVGLNATETSREVSFCAHAVFNRQPLNVPDATRDPRFAGNPLVIGAPYIRAYLGIPILTRKGHAIGTLCAIDTRARAFQETDVRRLCDCAHVIEEVIHTRELSKISTDVLGFAMEREKLFRDTFEQAAVGMTHSSFTGNLLRVNARACEMLGYSAEELHQISFVDITHPVDVPKNLELLARMASGELDQYRMEKRFLRKDETYLWVEVSIALKRTDSGEPDYMIAVLEDISARKQAEADLMLMRDSLRAEVLEQTTRLRESNDALKHQVKRVLESEQKILDASRRLRAITDNVPAMIGYWNRELRCEFANEGYREWFSIDPAQIVGMHMATLLGDEHYNKIEPHALVALDGHSQCFESIFSRADGVQRTFLVRYIPDARSSEIIPGFYVLITDVTESRQLQKELQQANSKLTTDSVTDYLTGLSNRRVFSERSEEACRRSQTTNEPYGLILLDLDNFKQINDIYGHSIGDDVLRTTGRLLRGQLRSHRDVAARLGGEEFAVLCFGDLDEELLRLVAEGLRSQISEEPIKVGQRAFNFTGSFGLAIKHATDIDWKTLYTRADAALYEAKAAGKNRVMFGEMTTMSATGKFRAFRRKNPSG